MGWLNKAAAGVYGGSHWMHSGFVSSALENSIPVVATNVATSITSTSADSGGTNMYPGNDEEGITENGVCWSTSAHPTTADSKHSVDVAVDTSFSASITGLSAETVYYYRAYAVGAVGTGYGAEYSFTTGANGEGLRVDGGSASSVYSPNHVLDGGGA